MTTPPENSKSYHGFLQKLYDWTIALAASPHAVWALACVSFLESSVFPIPPDVLLIPMILAVPGRAFLYAGICLSFSVLGGAFGYLIGSSLFELVGRPVLEFYGQTHRFSEFSESYNNFGEWAVLIAGVTPFPYKVITILSGATGMSFPAFVAMSILARGIRFFLIAILLRIYGERIRTFIERRLALMSVIFVALLLGGFLAIEFL